MTPSMVINMAMQPTAAPAAAPAVLAPDEDWRTPGELPDDLKLI